jgi:signal transduction histidine kinase
LRGYSLNRSVKLNLKKTKTKEFDELNATLAKMTEQIEAEFQRTKQFTENASHEIQTPLAIIRNKLELLIQSDNIRQEEATLIQAAYTSAERLSRLNKSLILLTRIENNEFPEKTMVDMGALVKRLCSQLAEKIQLKNLSIRIDPVSKFNYVMNETLAEILISNLISNSIRYSKEGSEILVEIHKNAIRISNPGEAFSVDPDQLFQRFFKISNSSESLGIGLSLAKTIAESYQLQLGYSYKNSMHQFTIRP